MTNKTAFGFWVYIMSDCVLFATLFATYAVLQGEIADGPAMKALVDLPFVTIETMLLLTSSFTVGLAVLAAHRKHTGGTLLLLGITLLLGLSFLGMELYEFRNLLHQGYAPSASAFLSSYWALVGTHGLHVAVGSLWMLLVMLYLATRGLTEGMLRKLVCLALFWHFLDIVWIGIFTFVYLGGKI